MKQQYTEKIENLDDFFGDCFGAVYLLLEGDTFGDLDNSISVVREFYIVDDVLKFIASNREKIIDRIGIRTRDECDSAIRRFEELISK